MTIIIKARDKFILPIFGWILYFFAMIVPKKKGVWVFGSWFGKKYSDNSRYFFEFCNKKKAIRPIWITKNREVEQRIKVGGGEAYYYLSIKGIFYQLISEFVFITQSVRSDLLPCCIGRKTKIVQMWHGLALKKIMYDVEGSRSISGEVRDKLFPFLKYRQDFVIATSDETSKVFSSAFRISRDKVLATGMPRNDVFRSSLDKKDEIYRVIYMPTFRGGIGDEINLFDDYKFDVERVNETLKENRVELSIRLHPVNSPPKIISDMIEKSSNIKFSKEEDIYDIINSFDCLITDFSSVYLDYILTGKHIIFSPFDFDRYTQNDRELYYDYESVTIAPYCYDWDMVINRVVRLKTVGYTNIELVKYRKISDIFHEKTITSSSENIYNYLISNFR